MILPLGYQLLSILILFGRIGSNEVLNIVICNERIVPVDHLAIYIMNINYGKIARYTRKHFKAIILFLKHVDRFRKSK